MDSLTKPHSPSCERNRDAILSALRKHCAGRRHLLEIGSGTGQHAVYFAQAMPHLTWQASDIATNLPGMQLWIDEAALPNLPPAIPLDVARQWPKTRFDAIFSANTLHIMSWEEVEKLFLRVADVLTDDAIIAIYGPFNYQGRFTSDSNARFNDWLQARGTHMAIRDFEAVDALASNVGLALREDREMPSNNRLLVWERHV